MSSVRFTNLPSFEGTIKKFAKQIEVDVADVVRKVSFDIFRGVTERTPVDTGWARASWNIAFNTPNLSVPSRVQGGDTAARNVNAQQSAKLLGDLSQFPVVWITNNLDYVQYLEAGHSKQMGKGFMLQRTLADVFAEIKTISAGLG